MINEDFKAKEPTKIENYLIDEKQTSKGGKGVEVLPLLESGRNSSLRQPTSLEVGNEYEQLEEVTTIEEKTQFKNMLDMSPILSSLYLTLKKKVLGRDITL